MMTEPRSERAYYPIAFIGSFAATIWWFYPHAATMVVFLVFLSYLSLAVVYLRLEWDFGPLRRSKTSPHFSADVVVFTGLHYVLIGIAILGCAVLLGTNAAFQAGPALLSNATKQALAETPPIGDIYRAQFLDPTSIPNSRVLVGVNDDHGVLRLTQIEPVATKQLGRLLDATADRLWTIAFLLFILLAGIKLAEFMNAKIDKRPGSKD